MKLKFKGPKNYSKGTLIVEKHAHESWKAGEEKEIADGKAHELLGWYPGMFEVIQESKAYKAPENKMASLGVTK